MRVKITVTVNIDAEAWTANYGIEGAAAIREDVKGYATDAVVEQFRAVGVLVES